MAMEFLNRFAERDSLRTALTGKRSVLGRLYGRRRVGKTELLRQAWEDQRSLFITVPEASLPTILEHLSSEAARQTDRPLRYASFRDFARDLPNLGVRLVVLDEFQRLMKEDKAAESSLQDVWDSKLQSAPVSLFLCGSVVGMMQRLDQPRAPLHGRFSWDLKLKPFRYPGVRLFYPKMTETQRVERFAVFGGTPHYHRLTRDLPLRAAIERMFLDVGAPLRDEHKLVIEMEVDRPERYHEILLALGQGARTLGEVGARFGQPASAYTPYIPTLRDDLGILRADDPLHGKKRNGRLFFDDLFFQFFFRFIFPQLGRLELGDPAGVHDLLDREFASYLGKPAFEEVARHMLVALNGQTYRGTRYEMAEIGAWWDGEDELDAVGVGRDTAYACEAKYREGPCGPDAVERLIRRAELFRVASGRKRVVPILLSRSGFTREAEARRARGEFVGWTLADVEAISESVEPVRRRKKGRASKRAA